MNALTGRRGFLVKAARAGAYTLAGGLVWGALVHESKAKPFVLRPPGALPEANYLGTCIRCGQCVDACPFDTLALAHGGEDGAPGMPRFRPRETPCYMCQDVPCARVCPTGALNRQVEITRARMGLAVLLDQETCLAFQGLRCEICYRVCPVMGKAITLRFRPQERTGRHAFFEPVVNADACTGCGMCEHACPLEETAIRVLPRWMARGRMAENYKLGWKPVTERPGVRVPKQWERDTLGNALETLRDTESVYEGIAR